MLVISPMSNSFNNSSSLSWSVPSWWQSIVQEAQELVADHRECDRNHQWGKSAPCDRPRPTFGTLVLYQPSYLFCLIPADTPFVIPRCGLFFVLFRWHILQLVVQRHCQPVGLSGPIIILLTFFPHSVARVPVSLWGCGGWAVFAGRCVYVCNRAQPLATVGNRWQPFARGRYGHAYGKFCKRGHFWMFPGMRGFILRGRRGTSSHSNMFHDVSKVRLCGTHNTLHGRRRTFNMSGSMFFCESHCQGCAKWWHGGNSVQNLMQRKVLNCALSVTAFEVGSEKKNEKENSTV